MSAIGTAEVWDILKRGGAIETGHFQLPGRHSSVRFHSYNGFLDPQGAEALGVALAGKLMEVGATVVMVWEELEDLLLGFVVARELGCALVRAYNDAGLVGDSPELPGGSKAVLVADQLVDEGAVRAVRALVENRDGSLICLGALVDPGVVAGLPSVGLVSASEKSYLPGQCPLCHQGVPLMSSSSSEGSDDGPA